MADVAILGAGPLGGELAFQLARRDAASTIALIDDTGTVAAGKALDILQAGPVQPFATRVIGTTDLFAAAGAPIVVFADNSATGEWTSDAAIELLKRFIRGSRERVVIAAGASHLTLVERAVRELGWQRRSIFGTAPEAFAAAVRSLAALEAERSPRDVNLTVLGVPPDHVVVPWADSAVGGFSLTRVLDEPARRRLAARAPHFWPPGPLALATAAAAGVEGLLGRKRQSLTAFVAPDDELGATHRAGAVPVMLGPWGIERVELPSLSGHERVALDNALLL